MQPVHIAIEQNYLVKTVVMKYSTATEQ